MSATIDYTAIAIITIFTTLCASFGNKMAEFLFNYINRKLKGVKRIGDKSST